MDRRVRYTRNAIKEALYKLLHENTLDQITVKEICAEADINRATFYRNYKDIYDLYETLEAEMIQTAFPDGFQRNDLLNILPVIYQNQTFYMEYFRSRLVSPCIKDTIEKMGGDALHALQNEADGNEHAAHIAFQYMLHGIVGVLRDWVDGGCAEPPDVLNSVLQKIIGKQVQ